MVEMGQTRFAALHREETPFVLPNAWDIVSGLSLHSAGFTAIGTTSFGVSASRGAPDGTRSGGGIRDLVHQLSSLEILVNADIEDGFSDEPSDVGRYVLSLGADGINLEDSTDHRLVDPNLVAEKLHAIRESSPNVFINARPDCFFLDEKATVPEFLARALRYVDAGADSIFLHGTEDASIIRAVAAELPVPLNVLAHSRLTRNELAELGVRRISTGSRLYRTALYAALECAAAVRDGDPLPSATPYAEVQDVLLHLRDGRRSEH